MCLVYLITMLLNLKFSAVMVKLFANRKILSALLGAVQSMCLFIDFQNTTLHHFHFNPFKVVDPRKLDLRQKQIILLSRIAILLLKGYFGREKINFHKKNLKHRKIILLINFIFDPTFFLIASYQILKNYAILINYKSHFQEKDSLQLKHFQFSKINKLLSNSAICL